MSLVTWGRPDWLPRTLWLALLMVLPTELAVVSAAKVGVFGWCTFVHG
jgi:hypothetical protein